MENQPIPISWFYLTRAQTHDLPHLKTSTLTITPAIALVCIILSVIWTFCPLISHSDIFSINKRTLILKIIGQGDVKHIMTLLVKIITSVLNVSTYIITSITVGLIRLAAILSIMSVSTFITAVFLYVSGTVQSET